MSSRPRRNSTSSKAGTSSAKTPNVFHEEKYHEPGHGPRDDFVWVDSDEIHSARRKAMLKAHPEIMELTGHDPQQKWFAIASVLLQLVTAYFIAKYDVGILYLIGLSWIWGGTINHSLMLAIHELSHGLFFEKYFHNDLFGLFCNIPLAVPLSAGFKKYHLLHHRYQGLDGTDPDLPSKWEGDFFRHPVPKFFFILFQPFVYIFRPLLTYPTKSTKLEYAAFACIVASNMAVLHFLGGKALAYFFLSTILGSGFHPLASHFIAEHYVWTPGFETYSYYGILNWFVYNVGWHNQHHDHPRVPGSRLPMLNKIAPEFYEEGKIGVLDSWPYVLWRFVVDPDITPFSRVKRKEVRYAPEL